MIRRFITLAALVAVFTASLAAPGSVLADAPIPPLRPDGPVVLPDGRVLPVKPASLHESSVQAEMLAAHGQDQIEFVPGDRPQPIGPPDASLSLYAGGTNPITPLGLAPASAPTATLAANGILPNGLRKEVLGFLPYWMLDAGSLQWMQYQLVSTIAYFGVAAYSDGTLATTSVGWSGWNSSAMTGVINTAHARGVRVVLTVTMMAWDGGAAQAALLGDATARANLVNAIVATVANRSADGVNLDFEPVSTPLRDQYTSFVRQLKAGLAAAGVGSYLTVCTMGGSAVWADGYDLAGLTATGAAEAVFVMGYDFSWSGSSRAGGVAPMESPYVLDVQDSIDSYISIIPGSRVIFGVPYYGRTWLTTSDALNAPTVAGASGSSKAYYYTGSRDLAATYGRRWDDVGKVPWFAYYDSAKGSWVQGYYDDAASLGEKYNMINARGLAGTGMWTLLMDQGDNALWNVIAAKFVTDMTPATYVPLAPARVLDSRFGNGLSGKFSAGVPRTFQVSGRGGVPANATAVTGNLTVTNQTAAGAAFLGPSPTPAPASSTLNFPVGDNRANGVTLALGAGGTLSATYLASSGSTDFVFDVTGYFVP